MDFSVLNVVDYVVAVDQAQRRSSHPYRAFSRLVGSCIGDDTSTCMGTYLEAQLFGSLAFSGWSRHSGVEFLMRVLSF